MNKLKTTFTALVIAAGGVFTGVTIEGFSGRDPAAMEVTLDREDLQRVLRDDAESRRKLAQDAGDELGRQGWLLDRRVMDLGISLREYLNAVEAERAADDVPEIYTNQNIPGLADLPRVRMVYGRDIWPAGADKHQLPDEAFFRGRISAMATAEKPMVLNIEHFNLDIRNTEQVEVDRYMAMMLTIIGWAKESAGGLPIGIYGEVPIRDHLSPFAGDAEMQAWRAANEYLAPIAEAVDVLYPSLYTHHTDPAQWLVYADAQLDEAEQYGKPTAAFHWPRFTSLAGAEARREMIGKPYWSLQIYYTLSRGHDAVIWDEPNHFANLGHEVWTEQTPWIVGTLDIIGERK